MHELYYILLTRCAKCQRLRELKRQKVEERGGLLVVGILRDKVKHPVTGAVMEKGNRILAKEGNEIMVFTCPLNPRLCFVHSLKFGEVCNFFEEKLMHHRMPDGALVECR